MEKPDTKEALVKFNINDSVFFKLTEEGYNYWKKLDDETYYHKYPLLKKDLNHYKNKADSNGFIRLQLHHFMTVFGGLSTIKMNKYFTSSEIFFYKKQIV